MRPEELTLADRRGAVRLLEKLTVQETVSYLDWCCRQLGPVGGAELRVIGMSRCLTAHEAYWDLVALGLHGLCLNTAMAELQRRLSAKGKRGGP